MYVCMYVCMCIYIEMNIYVCVYVYRNEYIYLEYIYSSIYSRNIYMYRCICRMNV